MEFELVTLFTFILFYVFALVSLPVYILSFKHVISNLQRVYVIYCLRHILTVYRLKPLNVLLAQNKIIQLNTFTL